MAIVKTIRCVECTDQLTAFQLGLLPEVDAEIVSEHIGACPNCRVFSEQLDQTAALLADFPQPAPPPELVATLGSPDLSAGAGPQALLGALCQLAESLDPDNAQDLVQNVFLSAAENNSSDLRFDQLARQLTDAALADEPEARSVDQFEVGAPPEMLDPDGDSAELSYPDFYAEGPDIGSFIDSPGVWGRSNVLTPEENYDSGELFGVVDGALDQLPAPLGQLIQLVDIEQLSLTEAAAVLRLDVDESTAALHRARVHVRGLVNEFIA
jgi:DNA-directed RNA polymerase specialized sigma24 family protein